jgi:hypothetical protein
MAKIRLDIEVLDGRNRPLRAHKTDLRTYNPDDVTTLETQSDGTVTKDFADGTDRVQVSFASRGKVLSNFYVFKFDGNGQATLEDNSLSDLVKIKGSHRNGDTVVTELAIVFPRLRRLGISELSGPFSFPKRSQDVITPPGTLATDFDINFGSKPDVEPNVIVFRIEHLDRPQMLAVAFRAGLNRADRPLLFFHHTLGQNTKDFENAAYPNSPVYLDLGFTNYLGGRRGMAYQVAASGKDVAFVLPLPQAGLTDQSELGDFDSQPDVVEDVLEEVTAFFNRRFRNEFGPVQLQSFAVGSFSSGILHLGKFLAAGGSLGAKVTNVIDIDGTQSDYSKTYPPATFVKKGRSVWSYSQQAVSASSSQWKTLAGHGQFPLPWGRWTNIPGFLPFGLAPIKTGKKVISVEAQQRGWIHNNAMPQFALYHALTVGTF